MAATTQERLTVSVREAAEMLCVSPRTLANWEAAGKIRSIKIVGRRLYSLSYLRTWLSDKAAQSEGGADHV